MGQICEYTQYVILIFTYPLPLLPLTGSYKLECLNPGGLLCLVKEVQHKMAGGVGVCIGGLGSEARLPHSHISAAHELYDLPRTRLNRSNSVSSPREQANSTYFTQLL